MILTMTYLLLIAALLGLAGYFAERICVAFGWPRRCAWLAALTGSLLLPALATFGSQAPQGSATPILSLPLLFDQLPGLAASVGGNTASVQHGANPWLSWPDWQTLNTPLTALWLLSSGLLLLNLLVASLRMRSLVSRVRSQQIDDQPILISDRLGPAVIGFMKPRIVLPQWLAEQDSVLRTQVLYHEREHIAARDHLALLTALLIVASMPWNIALWWQLRRLRSAIEMDCDRRVLRAGVDPSAYSDTLLAVGTRAASLPMATVAVFESMSELERRIRVMVQYARRPGRVATGARVATVLAVLSAAVTINAPMAQQPENDIRPMPDPLRPELITLVAEATVCIEEDQNFECARQAVDAALALPDRNAHETGVLQNLAAYISFEENDAAGAIEAYEIIAELPIDRMPAGLVSAAYRNLAALYVSEQRHADGLAAFDRWLALPFLKPNSRDTHFRAQLLYMLEDIPGAIAETERAIAEADDAPAHWYEQLYALQLTAGDETAAASTLEVIESRWPDTERSMQTLLDNPDENTRARTVGEYQAVVTPEAVYPMEALARGIEGYVRARYTVTTTGETADAQVLESSDPIFEPAALEAIGKYRHLPRMVDGTPIEVAGVETRIDFTLPAE